ncbi:MAG: tRNA (adenosine(37)-N6)-threonylcarbamoyltransferase complex ATPase subunit type 1 TsaE [Bacillota bacterium]|jgi:tRNA threonylcarbamoyladenosine biosynthesis protein TsaE
MKITLTTKNDRETLSLAKSLGPYLEPGIQLLLDGDLAAGKTVFAKGVGAGLGIEENIKSPSYTLLCIYEGRLPFYHFDTYHLNGIDDFYDLGFDEYLDGDGVALIEWASVVRDGFPYGFIAVAMEKFPEDENRRRLTFTAVGAEHQRVLKEWQEHEHIGL